MLRISTQIKSPRSHLQELRPFTRGLPASKVHPPDKALIIGCPPTESALLLES